MDKAILGREEARMARERSWLRVSELGVERRWRGWWFVEDMVFWLFGVDMGVGVRWKGGGRGG